MGPSRVRAVFLDLDNTLIRHGRGGQDGNAALGLPEAPGVENPSPEAAGKDSSCPPSSPGARLAPPGFGEAGSPKRARSLGPGGRRWSRPGGRAAPRDSLLLPGQARRRLDWRARCSRLSSREARPSVRGLRRVLAQSPTLGFSGQPDSLRATPARALRPGPAERVTKPGPRSSVLAFLCRAQ
ncbi:putative cuticle collagen 80 [Manis pentadactyla]|uniref:putative cuticle collagen 80 n=1 Tax=Manis pentadactyla TaxID=143292 RepID=UPI00255C6B76|nr:putative cuticle collagen 80 [Manis pentadactyla]